MIQQNGPMKKNCQLTNESRRLSKQESNVQVQKIDLKKTRFIGTPLALVWPNNNNNEQNVRKV